MGEPGAFSYAAFLDLTGRRCLVVGGGPVAARKARSLVEAGASVTVVAPKVEGKIKADPRLRVEERAYRDTDLHGVSLAICATDDGLLNRAIAADARDLEILVNVVDCPALCNFILPAVAARGPVQIAVSTGGKSPTMARKLRDRVMESIGPEYGELVDLLGEIRATVKERISDPATRAQLLERMSTEEFLQLVREGKKDEVRRRMQTMLDDVAREAARKTEKGGTQAEA